MKNVKPAANRKVITGFADIPVKPKFVEVEIPEWGEEDENSGELVPAVVLMREVSQGERRRFSARGELGILNSMNEAERDAELNRWRDWYDSGKREAEILKMCYVKEDGSQLWTNDEVQRLIEQVESKPIFRLISRAEEENLLTIVASEEFRKNG